MGRSPSITVGDAIEGLRVEHVKSRGLVRLTRWTPGGTKGDGVGLEVADFCARLGITTDVLGPARRYLLVADPARRGARHVVALFASEDEARAEFVRFRRSERGAGAWAEAVEITSGGEMRRLCWFGAEQPGKGGPREHGRPRARGLRSAVASWFTRDEID